MAVEEAGAVAVWLDVASTLIRDAAGSPISEITSTVKLEGSGGRLRLPGWPVTAVSAVEIDGEAVTDWKLRSGALTRSCGFPDGSEVEVTYTHGLPEVPSDIVDLVCRLAGQQLVALRNGETASRPLKTERIGDYAVGYDTDVDSGTMLLTDFQRNRLAARFGGGAGSVRSR
ncbi:hypothetical protein [Streptomyces europaeiscabiei]|uniref:hypothetical protein n=1 Tax=Streptomyces europaeiscabiei TaxID=146819 RepID=UPI0029BFEEB7|nr:hypothetical protein [Streptomyces europaeiscabiei]